MIIISSKRTPIKSILIFAVVFVTVFSAINCNMKPSEDVQLKAIDVQLKAMVENMDRGCPVQIDPYTSLTSIKLLPNKTIQYNYTLPEVNKEEINLDVIKKDAFPALLKKFKENPEAKPFRDLNVTLRHHYVDKNGEVITEYVITPEMYNNIKGNSKLYDEKSSL